MAANTKESDEKTRAIKEVRQPTNQPHTVKDISISGCGAVNRRTNKLC